MKAINIKWNTDGDLEVLKTLPTEIIIPDEVAQDGEDAISDYISDQTGFCHYGYEISDIADNGKIDVILKQVPLDSGLTCKDIQEMTNLLGNIGEIVPIEISGENASALGFYCSGLDACPQKDLVSFKEEITRVLDDITRETDDGFYEFGGIRAKMVYKLDAKAAPVYIFTSYNDEEVFGTIETKVFFTREAARSYLAATAKLIWGKDLERLMLFEPDDDSWGPDYISVREGGGIRYLEIKEIAPDVATHEDELPSIPIGCSNYL